MKVNGAYDAAKNITPGRGWSLGVFVTRTIKLFSDPWDILDIFSYNKVATQSVATWSPLQNLLGDKRFLRFQETYLQEL